MMWKIFIYKTVVLNTLENIFALAIKLLITNTFAQSTLFFSNFNAFRFLYTSHAKNKNHTTILQIIISKLEHLNYRFYHYI